MVLGLKKLLEKDSLGKNKENILLSEFAILAWKWSKIVDFYFFSKTLTPIYKKKYIPSKRDKR